MSDVQIRHTSDLPPSVLEAAHRMLDEAFAGTFSEHDWEHALGGMHALVWEGDELVGHASVVQRRLIYDGRALRCGYVEAVAVRADRRRRGIANALMAEMERIIRGAYEIGGLAASNDGAPLYEARGWLPWRGATHALTPDGTERTVGEDRGIYVFAVGDEPELDVDADLTCDWRDGSPW